MKYNTFFLLYMIFYNTTFLYLQSVNNGISRSTAYLNLGRKGSEVQYEYLKPCVINKNKTTKTAKKYLFFTLATITH